MKIVVENFAYARNKILKHFSIKNQLPHKGGTIYIWPTSSCSVGCLHCNYNSKKEKNPITLDSKKNALLNLIRDSGVWKLAFSGGGEPMEESDFVIWVMKNIKSSNLVDVELITSCFWAVDLSNCRKILLELNEATSILKKNNPKISFSIRISFDEFHYRAIGIQSFVNICSELFSENYENINFYIRSVLISGDTSLQKLSSLIKAVILDTEDPYIKKLRYQEKEVVVYFKNLIIDGRMSIKYLSKGLDLVSVDSFSKRFLNNDGFYIPGLVYNGPDVKQMNELALLLENNGSLKILESTSPDNVPSIDKNSWQQSLNIWYRDPITVALLYFGSELLISSICPYIPGLKEKLKSTNHLYDLIDKFLNTPLRRLFCTLSAINILKDNNISFELDTTTLLEAQDLLNKHIHEL